MNLFTTTLVNWPASYPATEHAGQSTTTNTIHILPSISGRTKGDYFDLPFLILRKLHFHVFFAKFEVLGEARNTKLMFGIRLTE